MGFRHLAASHGLVHIDQQICSPAPLQGHCTFVIQQHLA